MTPNTVLPPLPQPEFRLKWKGAMAAYFVDKPNIGDTDCFTADQMREYAIAALALRPGGEPSDWPAWPEFSHFLETTTHDMQKDAIHAYAKEFARAVLALRPVGGADMPAAMTAEQVKRLLTQSDLWDMHLHMGWYSNPEGAFKKHGAALVRAVEVFHGIKEQS